MARRGTNIRVVFNNFSEIAARLAPESAEIVAETLAEIDTTVQVGMAAGGGGRIYIRRGRAHQASSPGNMPARDLGALSASLQTELVPGKAKGYYYTVMDYGVYLEYGTSKMAPRPFMTPSAERARPNFISKFRNLERRLR